MSPASREAALRAARKAELIAASERARRSAVSHLPGGGLGPTAGLEAAAARIAAAAGPLMRNPIAIGALALVVAAAGPRRIFSTLRWALVTVPLHPLGRRLVSSLGARLLDALAAGRRPRGR